MWYRVGWGGANNSYSASYTNNRRDGHGYDAAGNVVNDGGQSFQYDAAGKQSYASGTGLQQSYDGDGMRVKKVEQGVATYYVRSSVLGGQVVCEINGWGGWTRGYVYLGGQLLAIQDGSVVYVHQDPVTKSQRLTDTAGNVVSGIELDPWGGETNRSWNQGRQPHQFTSYERDQNQSDDAQARRYNRWWSRFDQPDPFDGSYNLSDPQSFNRYSYVQNDPVNMVDPSGLDGEEVIRIYTWAPRWLPDFNILGFYNQYRTRYVIEDRFNERGARDPKPPNPEPPPPPPPPNKKTFRNCFNNNRFSSLFKGTRLYGAAKFAEIGPPTSLAGDTAAIIYKSTRTGAGGTTNIYASGLNYVFRSAASALGNPTIGGVSLKGALVTVGDIATPALAVPGAFSAGYNLSTAVQCGLGVIE